MARGNKARWGWQTAAAQNQKARFFSTVWSFLTTLAALDSHSNQDFCTLWKQAYYEAFLKGAPMTKICCWTGFLSFTIIQRTCWGGTEAVEPYHNRWMLHSQGKTHTFQSWSSQVLASVTWLRVINCASSSISVLCPALQIQFYCVPWLLLQIPASRQYLQISWSLRKELFQSQVAVGFYLSLAYARDQNQRFSHSRTSTHLPWTPQEN